MWINEQAVVACWHLLISLSKAGGSDSQQLHLSTPQFQSLCLMTTILKQACLSSLKLALYSIIIFGRQVALSGTEYAVEYIIVFTLCKISLNWIRSQTTTLYDHSLVNLFSTILFFCMGRESPLCKISHKMTSMSEVAIPGTKKGCISATTHSSKFVRSVSDKTHCWKVSTHKVLRPSPEEKRAGKWMNEEKKSVWRKVFSNAIP